MRIQRAFVSTILVNVAVLSIIAACGGSDDSAGAPPVATASVGPTGGTVQGSGVTLRVPEGAVSQTVTISIAPAAQGSAPIGYTALSPVFVFSPDGLQFAKPATVEIGVTSSDGTTPVIVWESSTGSIDELPTTANGAVLTASVMHFSQGFAGHRASGAPTNDEDATPSGGDDASSDGSGGGDSGHPITDASTCNQNGGSCDAGSQCCSGSCNGGTCGAANPALCGQQYCPTNLVCCTGVCRVAPCPSGG
jgi:hypothetical protein